MLLKLNSFGGKIADITRFFVDTVEYGLKVFIFLPPGFFLNTCGKAYLRRPGDKALTEGERHHVKQNLIAKGIVLQFLPRMIESNTDITVVSCMLVKQGFRRIFFLKTLNNSLVICGKKNLFKIMLLECCINIIKIF